MPLKDKTRKAGKLDSSTAPDIEFERLYRDRISGFKGKCTGFASYVSGCDQVLLVPQVGSDGKADGGGWYDDERLIDVEAEQAVKRTSRRGGPQQAPSRTS
jgi:hypothetical protein